MSFDWLSPAEREGFLGFMEERFGIAPERFSGFRLFRRGEYVNAVSLAAAEAAELFEGMDAGVPVAKTTHSGFHKPSTRGVQTFGEGATRNVVDLSAGELKALVEGRMVQAPELKGFVVLRHKGAPVGVGLAREGRLTSQLPRSMTEHLVIFEDN